jgi:hypothetical protein
VLIPGTIRGTLGDLTDRRTQVRGGSGASRDRPRAEPTVSRSFANPRRSVEASGEIPESLNPAIERFPPILERPKTFDLATGWNPRRQVESTPAERGWDVDAPRELPLPRLHRRPREGLHSPPKVHRTHPRAVRTAAASTNWEHVPVLHKRAPTQHQFGTTLLSPNEPSALKRRRGERSCAARYRSRSLTESQASLPRCSSAWKREVRPYGPGGRSRLARCDRWVSRAATGAVAARRSWGRLGMNARLPGSKRWLVGALVEGSEGSTLGWLAAGSGSGSGCSFG